jgi:hypothetical protein
MTTRTVWYLPVMRKMTTIRHPHQGRSFALADLHGQTTLPI